MKKLLLGIIVLSMTSCKLEIKRSIPKLKVKNLEYCPFDNINRFKFEGHSYIEFNYSNVKTNRYSRVVHDPECKKCSIRKSSIR